MGRRPRPAACQGSSITACLVKPRPMAKKLSNLFFSTIKRAARMQQKAFKQANASMVKAARKSAAKTGRRPASVRKQASPAAAPLPPAGQGSWLNLVHKTPPSRTELLGRLSYSLYRPAGRLVAGLPLVIMLHGCRQTAYEMALGTRMNHLADDKGFVVAYPQQTKRVQAMRCWRWFQPDPGHGLAEADAIAELAHALVVRHRLDATRVYIAGLSAGAGMAALTVLRHPALFAAAALHSGAIVGGAHNAASGMNVMRRAGSGEPVELLRPFLPVAEAFPGVPAMILHGRRDRVVSARNAEQLARQFSAVNGAVAVKETVLGLGTHREYDRQDFLKGGRPVVRLCLLREVGHAWSGGDARLKFNSEKGPRASLLIWAFFSMHRRPGAG